MYQPEIVYDALAPEGERLVRVYMYIRPIYVYTYISCMTPLRQRAFITSPLPPSPHTGTMEVERGNVPRRSGHGQHGRTRTKEPPSAMDVG